jgi:hypothetical protein
MGGKNLNIEIGRLEIAVENRGLCAKHLFGPVFRKQMEHYVQCIPKNCGGIIVKIYFCTAAFQKTEVLEKPLLTEKMENCKMSN